MAGSAPRTARTHPNSEQVLRQQRQLVVARARRRAVARDVHAVGGVQEEAAAVVASDPLVEPTGYGLGRAGWVSVKVAGRTSQKRWQELEEWIRTSYTLVAPKRLAQLVLEEDSNSS